MDEPSQPEYTGKAASFSTALHRHDPGLSPALAADLVVALHRPILSGIAGFLIVDQPLEQADFVVFLPSTLSSQDARDLAAKLYREKTVRGIIILSPAPVAGGAFMGVASAGEHCFRSETRGRSCSRFGRFSSCPTS